MLHAKALRREDGGGAPLALWPQQQFVNPLAPRWPRFFFWSAGTCHRFESLEIRMLLVHTSRQFMKRPTVADAGGPKFQKR